MNFWKTSLLFIIFGLVIFIAVMASKLLITGAEGGIYFLSFRPGFSLKADKNKLTAYKQELKGILGANPRVLVVLSSKLKKTQMATGWGENDAALYGEWKKWHGWEVFMVYLDKSEWQKLPAITRNRLLGLFIVREINKTLGAGKSGPRVKEPFLKL
jgi:hypothetical protein